MELVTTTASPIDAPIRIALVGSERVTRAGLRLLIDGHPGLRVIGEVEYPCPPRVAWAGEQPQIAVIDLDGHDSLEFVSVLREAGNASTRIIVLTSTPDSAMCSSAIERGALGVVSKQQAAEVLIKAIYKVHAGEVWLERVRLARVLRDLFGTVAAARRQREIGRNVTLTKRERQVVTLVAQSFRNSEIAASLFVSEATVRHCLASTFRKLGVSSRVHLMVYAFREGFVSLPISGGLPTASSPSDLSRLPRAPAGGSKNDVHCAES
jgi:two-component system, NarL family, nitrate/nitrite response regulator NarL